MGVEGAGGAGGTGGAVIAETALKASSNVRLEWADGDLASSSGSGGEMIDCIDVILPAAWALGRPSHKL